MSFHHVWPFLQELTTWLGVGIVEALFQQLPVRRYPSTASTVSKQRRPCHTLELVPVLQLTAACFAGGRWTSLQSLHVAMLVGKIPPATSKLRSMKIQIQTTRPGSGSSCCFELGLRIRIRTMSLVFALRLQI